MTGLPIVVSGQRKVVMGISASTEVSHVLEALRRTLGLKLPLRGLSLLEKWREMEKPLRCGEAILERWDSWGAEKSFVAYVLKRRKSDESKKKRLRKRSFKTTEFLEEVCRLVVLDEDDFRQMFDHDIEASRFLEAVRLHVSDLQLLSDLNSRLEEEESKLQSLLVQFPDPTSELRPPPTSEADLKALRSELQTQRRHNLGLETLIQVNADKIDYFREELALKVQEVRGLEYDFNVVEKEGRKLERQVEKLLKLKLSQVDEDDPTSSSGFSSAVSYDNDSSLDIEESLETFV